jgi:hypothetical protein
MFLFFFLFYPKPTMSRKKQYLTELLSKSFHVLSMDKILANMDKTTVRFLLYTP